MGSSKLAHVLVAALMATPFPATASTLVGWNNLGMHCMDSDYSVFSILPPYNTIEAQLIVNGMLVTSGSGYTVTYQAFADPDGSINTTSVGKGNFYTYTPFLYGTLAPDTGLLGWKMPGAANTPQRMLFETANSPAAGVSTPVNWFRAEGIPLMPFDDAKRHNTYPMMRLVARNSANTVIATADIVLPVSDEMDCRACHASGSQAAAMPSAGWVYDASAERDYRLNILRRHDEDQFAHVALAYSGALAARGYNAAGLYATVVSDHKPVLCAACHQSEALPGSGIAGIPPLTAAVHTLHADVMDPVRNVTLNNAANRGACYLCHPGSTTKCLRGEMGRAVAADGSMSMQCQSCHGSMSQVGSPSRVGWFMEPQCGSCHTGTATHNNGQIRYATVFTDAVGTVRVPVDATFATTPNTPAAKLSLYRFSVGHGGLQCSGCHGSTHAEFASFVRNDNIESREIQGHIGVIAECTSCHATVPSTTNGGPHGMHPLGASWVERHSDIVESGGSAQCRSCHGTDYRGTVLSLMQADRTVGGQALFRGAIVGCYQCHNGPSGEGDPGPAPAVSSVSAATAAGEAVAITLPATGSGLTLRIISQAAHGAVGLVGRIATYFPDPGFAGVDTFTFAAYNGSRNSNLGTGTVTVGSGAAVPPTITTQPASQTVAAGARVTFSVVATGTAPLRYQWLRNGADISGATGASYVVPSASAADAGSYAVVVTNSAGSVTSAVATLTVTSAPVAPAITTQPASQTVTAGASATFRVVASGTAPLSYQWRRNGTNIAGATSATFVLSAVTTAEAGTYTVVVRNAAGSVTSAGATLTVTAVAVAPRITTQPVSHTVVAGANVTFSVVATGTTPLRYQWRKNGAAISGATGATLALTGVTTAAAGSYTVVVSNAVGAVTSTAATLTVGPVAVKVVLTSSASGTVLREPASVPLTATVSPAGSVSRVQFLDGTSLLGTDSTAPYTFTAANLGSGVHVFTAQAWTAAGATVVSAPLSITVQGGN